MEKITCTNEDYLETILLLQIDGKTRSVDVSKKLNKSKAAISIAANELISKGLIQKEAYGDIMLTEKGRKIAENIFDKHSIIKACLLKIGVTEENAEIECCKIEHILSDFTIECLKKLR